MKIELVRQCDDRFQWTQVTRSIHRFVFIIWNIFEMVHSRIEFIIYIDSES